MIKKIILLISTLTGASLHPINMEVYENFCKSFLRCYDFSSLGKYAHEYHPALLSHTRESIKHLEQELEKKVAKIDSRLLIMGYEEHAMPNFFPILDDFKGGNIDDEFAEKKLSEWTDKVHNQFGIMSAFLFRGLPENVIGGTEFVPISVNGFEQIFEPCMRHFHNYCFGKYFKIIEKQEVSFKKQIEKFGLKQSLKHLYNFWESIYTFPSEKSECNIAITSDILFNIENARHLHESNLEIKSFFIGPDPTYPIETTKECNKKATRCAQKFLKKFITKLKPIDAEPTAYVFKSFVDGVGKSTLLGNIKNFLKHSLDFDKYEAVDNSSTIEYDIFRFSDDVFIADLPAQMSHSTFKPDGKVFVSLNAVKTPQKQQRKLEKYFTENNDQIFNENVNLMQKANKLIQKKDYFSPQFYNQENSDMLWARNILLFKKEDETPWLFFKYQDKSYLGKNNDNGKCEIKILLPIGDARSEGLKNGDPSQMLFYSGIAIPAAHEVFVKGLTAELNKLGIKRLVMVDFLSMYSRSSRENVRLNYLLQQTAMLNQDFELKYTIYDNYLCDAHLLSRLSNKQTTNKFINNIAEETSLRGWMNDFLQHNDSLNAKILSDAKVFAGAFQFREKHLSSAIKTISDFVKPKLCSELESLRERHGFTKIYQNLYTLDWNKIEEISNTLETLFSEKISSPAFQQYFSNFPQTVASEEIGAEHKITYWGEEFKILARVDYDCRNKLVAKNLLSALRKSWFQLIFNLLAAENENGTLSIPKPLYWPERLILAKPGSDGSLYFLYKLPEDSIKVSQKCLGSTNFNFQHYKNTNFDIFGFGQPAPNSKNYSYEDISFSIDFTVDNILEGRDSQHIETILPQHMLKEIKPDLQFYQRMMLSKAKRAQKKDDPKARKLWDNYDDRHGSKNCKTPPIVLSEKNFPQVAKLAQLYATMETFVRDINSTITPAPTLESHEATIQLFSKVILPQFFGILLNDSLDKSCDTTPLFEKWYN